MKSTVQRSPAKTQTPTPSAAHTLQSSRAFGSRAPLGGGRLSERARSQGQRGLNRAHAAVQARPVMLSNPAEIGAAPDLNILPVATLAIQRQQLDTSTATQFATASGNFFRFPAGSHHTNSTDRPQFVHPASAMVVYTGTGSSGSWQVHPAVVTPLNELMTAMHTEGQRIDDESLKQARVGSAFRPTSVAEGNRYLNSLRKTIRENPAIFGSLTFPTALEATARSELGPVGSATHNAFRDALARQTGWSRALAQQLIRITARFKAPRGASTHHSGLVVDINFPYATSASNVEWHGMDRNKNAGAFRAAAGAWLNLFSSQFNFDTYSTRAEIWHQEWLNWRGTTADPDYVPPPPPSLPPLLPSPLPYRQATNLLECIRIMGEENREYCTQQIASELENAPELPPDMTGLQRQLAGPAPRAESRADSPAASGAATPIVHRALQSPGQPLDRADRSFMEARFGHDFSRVRVHTDRQAAESARAINAAAYTVGEQIVFHTGRYAPGTQAGRLLLAHELAHTVQQSARPGGVPATLAVGAAQDPAEREAAATARAVLDERDSCVRGAEPAGVVRRTPDDAGVEEPAAEPEQPAREPQEEEPLDKAGRPLSEGDRENAAREAGVAAPAGPLDVTVQGARFVLHDTAASIGSRRIGELQALGRRSAGFGPGAYVPRAGGATVAHTPLFGPRRPTATEFEKAADVMGETARNAAYRRVWQATNRTHRGTVLDAMLAAQGSTGGEARSERSTAIRELNASSGNVHSAGIWTVEDICTQVSGLSVAASLLPVPMPAQALLISFGLADTPADAGHLLQGCAALAPLTTARTSRIGSAFNVEIVQAGGSQCRTTGHLQRLPDYTANQYRNLMQLYLRAALAAGQFPEITTHFWIDKNIGSHCDPRCFNLGHLYELIQMALHHRRGSRYGIVPNYGTGAAHNVWWHNTVCGGAPPSP